VPVLTIEKTVKTAVGDILESIELFDCYRGEQIPAGKKPRLFFGTSRGRPHADRC
jgi:phenylalanyl-tRNA synthetase beta chain